MAEKSLTAGSVPITLTFSRRLACAASCNVLSTAPSSIMMPSASSEEPRIVMATLRGTFGVTGLKGSRA